MGRFGEAISAHHEDIVICEEIGNRHGKAMTLNQLSVALRKAGQFDEAITACEEAIAIFQETPDQRHEGAALNNLGIVLREAGRFEEAITKHLSAAAIFHKTNDRHGEGAALNNLELDRAAQRTWSLTLHQSPRQGSAGQHSAIPRHPPDR